MSLLAFRLAVAGRSEEALARAQEALTICRRLADTFPDAALPDLAVSLINVAARLGEVGRSEEALAPAQEAVTIRHRLAEGAPTPTCPASRGRCTTSQSDWARRDAARSTGHRPASRRPLWPLAEDWPELYADLLDDSLEVLASLETEPE